jgi:hypothetical protein
MSQACISHEVGDDLLPVTYLGCVALLGDGIKFLVAQTLACGIFLAKVKLPKLKPVLPGRDQVNLAGICALVYKKSN